MQAGSTLSLNAKDSPEFGHRTTRNRNPSSFSSPKAIPLMDNQNIDDVMQGSMNSKSSLMASGSLKRPILAIRTVSPLVHPATDNTSPTPPMTMRQYLDPVPKFRTSLHNTEVKTDASPSNGHGRKGMAKTENLFQYETKERKRNEPSISSKIKDILEWRTMKLGTGVQVERQDHGSVKRTERAAGSMRDLWKGRRIESPRHKGPKAGQLYEIVNQHIIEDSMDRTVTISTWREQVDDGRGSDTDTTSIYYIGPDGYAREGAHMEVNARRVLGSSHRSRKETQGTPYGQVEAITRPSRATAKSRANANGYRHAQYYDTESSTTDPLQPINTVFPARNKEKHTRSRAKESGALINPTRRSLTRLKVPDGPFIQRQHHYQESTPIDKQLPRLPFHPTRSGSTITSIRSASSSDFDKFLSGCKPSLVHISDILRNLGIYKLEHLKAVARLSSEMRDREVKEVALGLGMTVVEWAILVDKIFQL